MPGFRFSLILLIGCTATFAQTQLVVEDGGRELVIVGFDDEVPQYRDAETGELRSTASRDFKLKPTDSFGAGMIVLSGYTLSPSWQYHLYPTPRFVDFKDRWIKVSLSYSATTALTSLFITAELPEQGVVLAREIPDLSAEVWTDLEVKFSVQTNIAPGSPPNLSAKIRFFSNGQELEKAASRFESIQRISDGAIERSIKEKNLRNAKLKVFSRTKPIYPPPFKEQAISGSAQIRCVVDPRGRVTEASILSATHPEFGEAAKAAALLWRFIPKIKSGKPVRSAVTIPFNFSPALATKNDPIP